MIIETFPVGLLQCNCTILGDEETGEAIIIAPSDGVDRYPRYTDFVRSLPPEERLEDASLCDATRASPESGRKVR